MTVENYLGLPGNPSASPSDLTSGIVGVPDGSASFTSRRATTAEIDHPRHTPAMPPCSLVLDPNCGDTDKDFRDWYDQMLSSNLGLTNEDMAAMRAPAPSSVGGGDNDNAPQLAGIHPRQVLGIHLGDRQVPRTRGILFGRVSSKR